VRGLLGLEESDLESIAREAEALCDARELMLLRNLLRALEQFRERLPPDKALEWLEHLIRMAAEASEIYLERFGPELSPAASTIVWETELGLKSLEKQGQGDQGKARAGSGSGQA